MGVGGNERSRFGARRKIRAPRELWCEMPSSLRRVLWPCLYSVETVRANLDFAVGAAFLSEGMSSDSQAWSREGSSCGGNSRLLVEMASRSSALPVSGSSLRDLGAWSSAFPLSGASLMPQRLFSSISRRGRSRCVFTSPSGVVGSGVPLSCSRRRADCLLRRMQVVMRVIRMRNITIPAVIPSMLLRFRWLDDLGRFVAEGEAVESRFLALIGTMFFSTP